MPTELLSIQPGELKFPFELKKRISSSLWLVNSTDNYVAFKVKTMGIGGSLSTRPFALRAWRVPTPVFLNTRTFICCSSFKKKSELTNVGLPDSQAERIVALVEAEGVVVEEKGLRLMELQMKALEDRIGSRIDLVEARLSSQLETKVVQFESKVLSQIMEVENKVVQSETKVFSQIMEVENKVVQFESKVLSFLQGYKKDLEVSEKLLRKDLEIWIAFIFLSIVFLGMRGLLNLPP